MRSRHDEMREQTTRYHREHPEVWSLFVKFTFDRIKRKFQHYGAKAIFERIRWETDQPDVEGKNTFKIGNNHPSFYARRFMKIYPAYEGFFRLRKQRSKDQPPTDLPELGPQDIEHHATTE
jgi:hypothetical protein